MSELGLFVGVVVQQGGAAAGIEDTQRKIMVRIGGQLAPNHPIDINSAEDGWVKSGTALLFSDTAEFLAYTQVYRNGQLLYPVAAGDPDAAAADAYVAVSGSGVVLAFGYVISTNDFITIWKFSKAPA